MTEELKPPAGLCNLSANQRLSFPAQYFPSAQFLTVQENIQFARLKIGLGEKRIYFVHIWYV